MFFHTYIAHIALLLNDKVDNIPSVAKQLFFEKSEYSVLDCYITEYIPYRIKDILINESIYIHIDD